MNKFVTVWMVYATNPQRTEGTSRSLETEDDAAAIAYWLQSKGWDSHYVKQQYEIDDDGHYDCGDDE